MGYILYILLHAVLRAIHVYVCVYVSTSQQHHVLLLHEHPLATRVLSVCIHTLTSLNTWYIEGIIGI